MLDFDELAAYLRVDRRIVGQYLDEIPSFEMGGKLLFRKKSVEAWIASKENRPEWRPIVEAGGPTGECVLSIDEEGDQP